MEIIVGITVGMLAAWGLYALIGRVLALGTEHRYITPSICILPDASEEEMRLMLFLARLRWEEMTGTGKTPAVLAEAMPREDTLALLVREGAEVYIRASTEELLSFASQTEEETDARDGDG